MPTVSDYVIVNPEDEDEHNPPLDTSTGHRERKMKFRVPSNVNRGQQAVATWQFEAEGLQPGGEGPPNNLEWNLTVNGKQLVHFTHHINRFNALQEVFPGSVLRAGDNNEATVQIIRGTGRIKFSDFVIFIQVDIESPPPVGG